jgi:long-chain acyl-CoA synthetase
MSVAPWIKSYPRGVHWDAELTTMPVQQILERSAAKWQYHPALDFMNKKIRYRELNDLANRAAKGFQKLGVRPGVHVGLYLPNTPHYIIAFFGVMKAGGTVVNYSPLDAERVLEHKVDDSETDILVTLDLKALYPQMGRLLGTTRLKILVVGTVAEMTPAPEAVRAQMSHNGETVTVPKDSRHVTFEEFLNNDGEYLAYPIADLRESVAVLQYTGGTTGLPKGAMLTHANLSSATAQYVETTHTQPQLLDEGHERILAVLPPFHIYALTVNMLMGIRIGAELILPYPVRRGCGGQGHFREEGYGLSRRANDVCCNHQPSRRRRPRSVFDQVVRLRRSPSSPGGAETLPGYFRLPAGRGLGHDRNIADRYIYTARGCSEAGLVRHSHPRYHDQVC